MTPVRARHPSIELLRSKTLIQGTIFDVVSEKIRLPSGLEQDLMVVDHPGAVCIAPLLEDGRLLLVKQYRHATGDWLLEIPAGRLEPDESPRTAAERELEEETGYRARTWTELRSFFPAPGFLSEKLTLFLAEGLEPVPGGGLSADEDEEIELVRLAPEDVLTGATEDAKTLLAAALLSARDR